VTEEKKRKKFKSSRMRIIACFFIGALLFGFADAWGNIAHEIIANMSQNLLSQETLKSKVNIWLQNNDTTTTTTMRNVASWADEIKFEKGWEWSYDLHFVDLMNDQNSSKEHFCQVNLTSDCPGIFNSSDKSCLVNAIANFTNILRTQHYYHHHQIKTLQTFVNKTVAFKFLIHFIGDVHQPLHVAFEKDKGGNLIHVHWNVSGELQTLPDVDERKMLPLHECWDSTVLEWYIKEHFQGDRIAFETELFFNFTDPSGPWFQDAKTKWITNQNLDFPSLPWAQESASFACNVAYRHASPMKSWISTGDVITESDAMTFEETINLRLAQAAVRLAFVIESI